nr:hypothetical protein [Tanacetum cinerariifolium]
LRASLSTCLANGVILPLQALLLPASDGPELVRNSSWISSRIWGSNVCKAF